MLGQGGSIPLSLVCLLRRRVRLHLRSRVSSSQVYFLARFAFLTGFFTDSASFAFASFAPIPLTAK